MIYLHCAIHVQLLSCFSALDKPAITDKLPPRVPVFHGYPVVLICEASGYPEPSVAWIVNNNRFEGGNLTVKDNGGDYTCIANNSVGSDTRVVQVVQKGNNTLIIYLHI